MDGGIPCVGGLQSGFPSNQSCSGNFTPYKAPAQMLDLAYVKASFVLCYCLVFIACFVGNLLVVYAIARHPCLRTATNIFLLNLAAADFCVGVFCVIPTMFQLIWPTWVLGRVMCKVYAFINQMSYTASVTILVSLSAERYCAILYPLRTRRRRTKVCVRSALVFIWLFSTVYGIPYAVAFDTVVGKNDVFCFQRRLQEALPLLVTVNFVFLYVIPVGIMGFLYARMGFTLQKSLKEILSRANAAANHSSEKTHGSVKNDKCAPGYQHAGKCTLKPTGYIRVPQSGQSASDVESLHSDDTCGEDATSLRLSTQNISGTSPSTRSNCSCGTGASEPAVNGSAAAPKPEVKSKPSRGLQRRGSGHNALLSRRRVIRMLAVVVATFAVCVLPYHLRLLLEVWGGDQGAALGGLLPQLAFVIMYLNSGLNPLLYAFLSRNFRRCATEAILCRIGRKTNSASTTLAVESRLARGRDKRPDHV